MVDEAPPGITFHLESAQVLQPSSARPNVQRARVELTAEYTDFGVWEEVQKKLDGLHVPVVANFADEMVSVLTSCHEKSREAYEREINQLREELARAKQQASFAQGETSSLRKQLDAAFRANAQRMLSGTTDVE